MGIIGLIGEAKLYIRRKQYERAVQFEGKMEQSKIDLKRAKSEEAHYNRLKRIQDIKAKKRNIGGTPLQRIGGAFKKVEQKEIKQESPFSMGSGSSPFNESTKKII